MSGRQPGLSLKQLCKRLLAPGLCLGCGVALDAGASFCASCREQLLLIPNPCDYCGQPNPVAGPVCPACLLNPPRWQKMIAPLEYRGLTREYLHRLKYDDALYLGEILCRRCLAPLARAAPLPQALLPVPLHRSRLLERGYNQALEIALTWSAELDIPVERQLLSRIRATESQACLSAAQREHNLRGAFACAPRRPYRHVAIVDDIVTTGSTADEITRLLHRNGVDCVEVWALARVYSR